MNKFRFILVVLIFVLSFLGYFSENAMENGKKRILILVENRLTKPLEASIKTYRKDLQNEGYSVEINSNVTDTTSCSVIRRILKKNYQKDYKLIGSVFIGKISAPLFNTTKDKGDPYWHDYLSDFYYMDLDGIWTDSNQDGVNDQHKDTNYDFLNSIRREFNYNDNRTPEIWVSRIRADMLTDLGNEIVLLRKYFRKNHNYRTGKMDLPAHKAFVVSAGVKLKKSDWGAFPEKLYKNIDRQEFTDTLGNSLRRFLNSKDGYEWGVINVFSGPRIHHFSHFNNEIDTKLWNTREGRKLIAEYSDKINTSNDVSWKDIISIQPKVLFYHLLTSEVGRHDFPNYLGGTYLFSGYGLVAIAGTQHSGSVGSKQLYDYIARGNSIGMSWKKALSYLTKISDDKISIFYHPNVEERIKAGKSIYKAVLLGDGTLKLPSHYSSIYKQF